MNTRLRFTVCLALLMGVVVGHAKDKPAKPPRFEDLVREFDYDRNALLNIREEHKENCRKCMKHMIVTCEELGLVSSQALVSHAYDEADLHFLSEAAAQFRFFKSGWRVRVAHGRATYNEPEAIEAITSARFSRLWLLV